MRTRTTALPSILLLSCAWPMLAGAAQSSFNPDISLIMDIRASDLAFGGAQRLVPGFLLGPEAGPGSDGFALGESELTISSNIDDRFYGYATIALSSDAGETGVELEEAYIQTLSLPDGFTLRAGRFFSSVGYQNARHGHTWDFVDASLPQRVMLANNFGDAGLQLRWIAPTDLYLELGTELFQGDDFPSGGAGASWSLFAKLGGDLSDSQSWLAGVSWLSARADGRETVNEDPTVDPTLVFTGDSDLAVLDLTWKWSPHGNWRQRNAVVSAAVYQRSESGSLDLLLDPVPETGSYSGDQTGYYLQGTYQFRPRWRVGLRLDGLSSDNTVVGFSQATVLDDDRHSPSRISLMLDFANSEYSRLRLQFNHDQSGVSAEDQVYLQFIGSLGPHGAHSF